ncbi:20160_t:CDS:2, partial [Gigaspora rosea]
PKSTKKKIESKILSSEIPNVTLIEDDYSYYQQYFTDKLKDEYFNSEEPFSNQTPAFHIETRRINDQKRSEFRDNFSETHNYDRDYFFTAVRQYTRTSRNRVNPLIDKSDDDRELALSTDCLALQQDLNNHQNLNDQNLENQNLVITKDAILNCLARTSDQVLIDTNLDQTAVRSKNKDRIWQNNINTINNNWKFSFETLAQSFSNHFSEQIRKSNIYQTTEKAYEELKIEHG